MGLLVVACADDAKVKISANPAAPVLSAPSQKTTAYRTDSAAYVLSLDSTGIAETFVGTPADYSVKTTVNYSLQIDKAGNNFANPLTLTSSTKDTLAVTVMQLYNIITNPSPSGLNSTVGVKASFDVRVMATIGANLQTLYSNVRTIKVNPRPSLKPYNQVINLVPYYIVGLGDGAWNNSAAGLGKSLIPLSVVPGSVYNSAGAGVFTYTGYFMHSNGFKLIRDIGSWTEQWGMTGTAYVHNGGDNITVPTDGYYKVTLNSITNNLTIVPATAPSKSYTTIGMIGEFNSWGADVVMSPTFAANNHVWYATYTFAVNFTPPVGSGGMKFRANGAWTDNWGAGYFPAGIGTNGGTNIPFLKGTYVAVFNDVDGSYFFIKQ